MRPCGGHGGWAFFPVAVSFGAMDRAEPGGGYGGLAYASGSTVVEPAAGTVARLAPRTVPLLHVGQPKGGISGSSDLVKKSGITS